MRIEQTLTSMEVAEMVEKEHAKLLRDIKRYVAQLAEAKIGLGDFFRESTYKDANNQTRPCYQITKKGCEFVAHKLTGVKGTAFTARYINRFHEMEEELQQVSKQESERPWFIRKFLGKNVILIRDFSAIIGMDVMKHKKFLRLEYFTPVDDWNGFGWKCDNEKFKRKWGFDDGDDSLLTYFTLRGARKAIRILQDDSKVKMLPGAAETILNGIEQVRGETAKIENKRNEIMKLEEVKKDLPFQINIYIGSEKGILK